MSLDVKYLASVVLHEILTKAHSTIWDAKIQSWVSTVCTIKIHLNSKMLSQSKIAYIKEGDIAFSGPQVYEMTYIMINKRYLFCIPLFPDF